MEVYRAARQHGKPIELHVYENGGHGFGLGVKGGPVASWSDSFVEWLSDLNSSQ
jgi:acetyl esterase/lipase